MLTFYHIIRNLLLDVPETQPMDVDITALERFLLTQPLQTNDTAAIPPGHVHPDSPLPGLDPAQPGPAFPELHRDVKPPPPSQIVQYYQSLIPLTLNSRNSSNATRNYIII